MNQQNLNRHQAGQDSRRVATGARCRVLRGKHLFSFLIRNTLVPKGVSIDPTTGYDSVTGAMLVVPFYLIEEFNLLMGAAFASKNVSKEDKDTLSRSRGPEALNRIDQVEQDFVKFLRTSMVLVNIPLTDPVTRGRMPTGDFDVLVDTLEVRPNEAVLVVRNIRMDEKKWNKR